ncbi:MAG: putative phosphoribosyl transferase [Clostridia bacterium]|jgi:orotate phosphoribosyltransferase|nr:putative phosphoribosyl transferase [Clostridia bacterium]
MDIIENKTSFVEKEVLMLAGRENNSRRSYVVVNRLQAKHVPVSPEKTVQLFNQLGELIKEAYPNETILMIGFAETATAIGAYVAEVLGGQSYYLHTTREEIKEVQKLVEFCEEHSHATEQILYCKNWPQIKEQIDRIVFVEDEVTTGKTILNFVKALKDDGLIDSSMKLAVASVVNGMDETSIERFRSQGIEWHYLLKLRTEHIEEQLLKIDQAEVDEVYDEWDLPTFEIKKISGKTNPRVGVPVTAYVEKCDLLADQIIQAIGKPHLAGKKVLVMGTEEFMYPAIKAAEKMLKECEVHSIRTHSTTRSPILPFDHKDYPLKSRYALTSFYSDTRQTYIYNLAQYDYAVILTDANESTSGFGELCKALAHKGCDTIMLIKWVE